MPWVAHLGLEPRPGEGEPGRRLLPPNGKDGKAQQASRAIRKVPCYVMQANPHPTSSPIAPARNGNPVANPTPDEPPTWRELNN